MSKFKSDIQTPESPQIVKYTRSTSKYIAKVVVIGGTYVLMYASIEVFVGLPSQFYFITFIQGTKHYLLWNQ